MNNQPNRSEFGLAVQTHVLVVCLTLRDRVTQRVEQWRSDERGEVTATTALIMLLVAAAVVAGGVIANKINSNATRIPDP